MLLPTIKLVENYISMGWWGGVVVVQVHFPAFGKGLSGYFPEYASILVWNSNSFQVKWHLVCVTLEKLFNYHAPHLPHL